MENQKANDDSLSKLLASQFRGVLDRHGYGFQYAILHKLLEICTYSEGSWIPEVAEFPTSTGRFDTRIDFIVRPQGSRFFLAAECKRANPALNNWCFARASYIHREQKKIEKLLVEEVVVEFSDDNAKQPTKIFAHGKDLGLIREAYHIGFEIKNPRNKGECEAGAGRGAIEEAAGQICKGVNGLVTAMSGLSKPHDLTRKKITTLIMPAIFTTASLWTSDVDLGRSDIKTGNLPADTMNNLQKKPWIFLQYPISPAIKHTLPTEPLGFEFAEMLDPHYLRTIAVISAEGIDKFLVEFPRVW